MDMERNKYHDSRLKSDGVPMSTIDPFSPARKQDPKTATRQIKGGREGHRANKEKAQPSGNNAFLPWFK
jgi:hypothetical protein